MKIWLACELVLALVLAMGCAAFEQSPNAVPEKLAQPDRGQLYVPEPVQ